MYMYMTSAVVVNHAIQKFESSQVLIIVFRSRSVHVIGEGLSGQNLSFPVHN